MGNNWVGLGVLDTAARLRQAQGRCRTDTARGFTTETQRLLDYLIDNSLGALRALCGEDTSRRNTMRRTVAIATLLLCVILAAGCAARPAIQEESLVMKEMPVPASPERAAGDGWGAEYGEGGLSQRMIIYTTDVILVVEDTAGTIDAIKSLVTSYEGYLSSSRSWYEGPPEKEQLHARLSVRVPAESLDQVVAQLKSLAVKVKQENLSGQDVTEEYSDLSAQLTNLEATEVELRELLTEVRESRGKADEILQVHARLTEIRGEIEQLKGRMQYLERSAAMARIDIELMPEEAPVDILEDEWKITRTLRTAARALVNGLQGLADVLIYLVILSPIWAIPVGIIWLLRKLWRKRRARRAVAKAEKGKKEETSAD